MKIFISRKDSVFLLLFCFFLFNCFSQINHSKTVKVGYYENEVFQEGASENLIKKVTLMNIIENFLNILAGIMNTFMELL